MSGPTTEQVALVQETWATIYQNKVQNGVDLFIALFTHYPQYQDHFRQLKGLTHEQLKTSPKMKAHATTVMSALQSWVENLTDLDVLAELVRKNAIRHEGRGLKSAEFHHLWDLMPVYLEAKLGDANTEVVKAAWGAVVGVMVAVTDAAFNEDESTKY